MLDRLYSLYVTVIGTIKAYGDYFWTDVVEKVDEMGEQVRAGPALVTAWHSTNPAANPAAARDVLGLCPGADRPQATACMSRPA